MPVTRKGYLVLALILLLFIVVTALALSDPPQEPLTLALRLAGLYGFLMIAIATLMTPFLSSVYRIFGTPFLKIHHLFAAFGIVLATVHPLSLAVLVMNPAVFIPRTDSWLSFWRNAGRVAFILIYVALAGALLRKRIAGWRYLHALMYLVLLFAIIHANLVGTDFTNPGILVIFNGIFAAVVLVFFYSLWKKAGSRRSVRGGTGS
jgi:DMSO/TMAO reductase YedYZ heme-binding membrane subunit